MVFVKKIGMILYTQGGNIVSKKYDRPLARNRKATFDYSIEETIEAGIVLKGTEIKSIRAGKVTITDAHIRVLNGEAHIINMHISPYDHGNRFNHDPTRSRILLLHRKEIDRLFGTTQQKGYALIPLRLYIKRGFAKVLIGLGKGKKQHDKRHDLKEKQMKRDIDRAMKDANQ